MSCDIMLRMITPGLATLASSALSCYAAKLEKLAVTAQESYETRTKELNCLQTQFIFSRFRRRGACAAWSSSQE